MIKWIYKLPGKVWYSLVGVLAIIFFMLIILLVVEYRFFKLQAEKMIELQTEYKNHIMATKRLLQGSSLAQTNIGADTNEKKNSDDDENGWLLVNRGTDYCKDISLAYYKEINNDELFFQVSPEEWIDYTEWTLNELEKNNNEKKPSPKKQGPKWRNVTSDQLPVPAYLRAKGVDGAKKIFSWPIEPKSFWLSSLFGPRKKPNGSWGFHYGLDMAAIRGTLVKAVAPGRVIEKRNDKNGYGKTILIVHNKQYRTRYAHLDTILVNIGQTVERSQLIGRVGNTGAIRKMGFDGSHLHFEVSSFGKRLNPLHFIK